MTPEVINYMNNTIENGYQNGVFYFTNATSEDFMPLWNNKEYLFPAGTSTPMIISGEPPENIQEIRKRFAYKLAQREFFKSDTYETMSKQGNGLPPTPTDKVLQGWIDQCLAPLPITQAKVKDIPREELDLKASVAVGKDANLNETFKNASVPELGQMSE